MSKPFWPLVAFHTFLKFHTTGECRSNLVDVITVHRVTRFSNGWREMLKADGSKRGIKKKGKKRIKEKKEHGSKCCICDAYVVY